MRKGQESALATYGLVAVLMTVGISTGYVAPVEMAGITRRYVLSSGQAGGIVTAEMVSSAVTAFGLAGFLQRTHVARLSLFASFITLACQIFSAIPTDLAAFVAARIGAGLGCGVLYATACFWASQHSAGVRILSVAFIVASTTFALAMIFLPAAILRYGLLGLFAPLSIMAVIGILAVLAGENLVRRNAVTSVVGIKGASAKHLALLLAACTLGNISVEMLWTFAEASGEARGFSVAKIAAILSGATFLNVFGSGVAAILDRKKGLSGPMTLGMLGGTIAGITVAVAGSFFGSGAGYLLCGFVSFFTLPYFLGAGAALDGTGRAATLAAATSYLATAVAPVVGGVIADHLSLTVVDALCAGGCLLAALCSWILRPALDGDSTYDSQPAFNESPHL